MSRTSFTLVMLALAGSMALALGIVGIYAVLSYVVSQRTARNWHSTGAGRATRRASAQVRAPRSRPGGVGIAIGLLAAAGLTQLLSSLLFGVSPLDPVTYTGVPIILAMAAALASYVAVHRATAVDPVDALKAE